jgi:hypothetical protein
MQSFSMMQQLPTGVPSSNATIVNGTVSFTVCVLNKENTISGDLPGLRHHFS